MRTYTTLLLLCATFLTNLAYANTVPFKACISNTSSDTVYFTVSSVYRSVIEKTSGKTWLPAIKKKKVCARALADIDPGSVQYGIYQIRVDYYKNKLDKEPFKT